MGYLLTLFIIVAALMSTTTSNQRFDMKEAEVNAIAGSMMVYRNAVASYAQGNPAVVGVVSDAALGLPAWYVKPPNLGHYLFSGRSYVYFTDRLPGLAGALAHRTESVNVGTNSGGFLSSPTSANTGIALPAQIPFSAVVIMQ
jgi:hypothetical protein